FSIFNDPASTVIYTLSLHDALPIFGPFNVEFIPVAHSIPESHALAIHTSAGTVLHTGDWKIDPTPVTGPPTDERRLRELGEAGRSEEHTSELQSPCNLVCRLLLEKK